MKRKQENENKLRDVYNYINDNKITTQNVLWTAKNSKRDEVRNYYSQKKKFDIQQEKFLDLRRKKLSERLNKEEAMYHQELINNQESPDDVRRRMEAKLKELREQRLNDRDENVQKLQEKRFYEATDELRKNDSEAFAVECYLEQENQMLDKLKKREKEKREEMFYVKLNEFDMEKKKEKELEEEKLKKNKLKNIYDYQQWQREQNEKAIKCIWPKKMLIIPRTTMTNTQNGGEYMHYKRQQTIRLMRFTKITKEGGLLKHSITI